MIISNQGSHQLYFMFRAGSHPTNSIHAILDSVHARNCSFSNLPMIIGNQGSRQLYFMFRAGSHPAHSSHAIFDIIQEHLWKLRVFIQVHQIR